MMRHISELPQRGDWGDFNMKITVCGCQESENELILNARLNELHLLSFKDIYIEGILNTIYTHFLRYWFIHDAYKLMREIDFK